MKQLQMILDLLEESCARVKGFLRVFPVPFYCQAPFPFFDNLEHHTFCVGVDVGDPSSQTMTDTAPILGF